MRNERGVTLVELLAVIILLATVFIILFSIITSGFENFDRTSTKQKLQQEGNYITEVIRNEYLTSGTPSIKLEVGNLDGVDGTNKKLSMNGSVISTGFTYALINPSNKFEGDGPLHLVLTISEKGHSYEINTTFTKLN